MSAPPALRQALLDGYITKAELEERAALVRFIGEDGRQNGGDPFTGPEPADPVSSRFAWASLQLADDPEAWEGLLRGLPVPRRRLRAEVLSVLGLPPQGSDYTLTEEHALRLELALGGNCGRPIGDPGARESAPAEPFLALNLDTFLSAPPPDPDWDWRGWYARADVVLIAGDPGVGKSLVTLASTREGELLGDKVAARRAIFIDLESPEDVVFTRLYGFGLRGSVDGFSYIHRPAHFNLLDAECLARLKATIAASDASLVVVDSLRRAAPGLDENDSREVSLVFTALRDVAAELRCTIVVVHHPRKPVGDVKVEALYAARGSGDLIGSVDSYLFFRKLSGGLIRVEHGKARRGREHEPVHFRIVDGEAGEPVIEHVLVEDDSEQAKASGREVEALAWILPYVEDHPGASKSAVAEAFARTSGKGGRALARRVIDGELDGEQGVLAKGPGRAANGVYLYPASDASSPLAHPLFGEDGEYVADPESGRCLPPSPSPRRGGERSGGEQTDGVGEQYGGEEEIERLADLAREAQEGMAE